MKKIISLLLTGMMLPGLVACGQNEMTATGGDQTKDTTENVSTASVYTVGATTLDPNVYPADYPLIAFADFKTGFATLRDGIYQGTLDDYQDVVDIFGIDGAYYENCDLVYDDQLYKYYGWYADNDTSVLVTFKAEGDTLKCYAYTENGVISDNSD